MQQERNELKELRKTRWDGEGFNRYLYLPDLWEYPAHWLKLDEDVIKREIKAMKAVIRRIKNG